MRTIGEVALYLFDVCRFYIAVLLCMFEARTTNLYNARLIVQIARRTGSIIFREGREIFWIAPRVCFASPKINRQLWMSPKVAVRVPLNPPKESPLSIVLNEPGPISNEPHRIYRHLFRPFYGNKDRIESEAGPIMRETILEHFQRIANAGTILEPNDLGILEKDMFIRTTSGYKHNLEKVRSVTLLLSKAVQLATNRKNVACREWEQERRISDMILPHMSDIFVLLDFVRSEYIEEATEGSLVHDLMGLAEKGEIDEEILEGCLIIMLGTNHQFIMMMMLQHLAASQEWMSYARQGKGAVENIVEEALRLYSPVFNYSRRLIRDFETKWGTTIPKGTVVLCKSPFESLNPISFPDPLAFKPDRWDSVKSPSQPSSLIATPFLVGPRSCVAQFYMRRFLVDFVTIAVQEFDFEPVNHLSEAEVPLHMRYAPMFSLFSYGNNDAQLRIINRTTTKMG